MIPVSTSTLHSVAWLVRCQTRSMKIVKATCCWTLTLPLLFGAASCASRLVQEEGEVVPIGQLELRPADFDGRRILVVGYFTLRDHAILVPLSYWAMHDASPVRLKSGVTARYCYTPGEPDFLISGIAVTRRNRAL